MAIDTQEFTRELAALCNKHSIDNATHTPDHILANLIVQYLEVHAETVGSLMEWHRWPSLGQRLFNKGGFGTHV